MWDRMPAEIQDEILDPKFDSMTHGKKATYAGGCRGPLCAYADNEDKKAQYRRRAAEEGREVREYRKRDRPYDESTLTRIIEWHHLTRDAIGFQRSMIEHYEAFVKAPAEV